MSNLSLKHRMRIVLAVFLAAAIVALLIQRHLKDPDLQTAVVGALAADDPLLEAALDQYPMQAPAILLTYGQLPLFREQLARFGPQVVPIVAAYQDSFTTADARQLAREAWQALHDLFASWRIFVWPLVAPAAGAPELPGEAVDSNKEQTAVENDAAESSRLSPEDRGLIALLKMREERNAFVGQWEIKDDGEATRTPSRLVTLAGPELLIGGLTALERRLLLEREIDWRTYRDAIVDVAAIASGAAALRFLKKVPQGIRSAPTATKTATLRSGAREVASVLGIKAVRYGLPIGLVALMVLHPIVFTHYLCVFAESFGMPCILGPIVGWGIVIVPLAFLLSWALLSVRLLRFAAWLLAGVARGCQVVAGCLATAGEQRSFRAGGQRGIGTADRA